jgi:seryl-tRNA synthetase
MLSKFRTSLFIIFVYISVFTSSMSLLAQEVKAPHDYAADKLANADAQLTKLIEQRNALNSLIKAVKKDLKAAKIRAKAEEIQTKANVAKQDAEFMLEQSGVAIDLPDLTAKTPIIPSTLLEDVSTKTPSSFNEDSFDKVDSVFFPSNNSINVQSKKDLPYYIK